jgi:O-antigen/teichoic acid export membrane protein
VRLAGLLHALRSKFMQDTATLQVSAMINQASQLVSTVVIAFLLGSHGQGLFFLAISLQALFYNLVNVGVVQATITQVAAASVRDSRVKVAGWLAFLVKSYLVFSVLLIGLGWFVLPALSVWWYSGKVGAEQARELGLWAWWLTWWPLIDTPRAVAQVAFQGTRRMLRLGQLDNATELVRVVCVMGGALIEGSARGAVLGEIASRILGSLLGAEMYAAARRDGSAWLPSLREVFRQAPDIPLLQGIRLGLRVGLLKNGNTLFMEVFPGLILGGVAGASWVAYFRVASKIMGLPMMLLQGVTRTILPALSELRGLRDLGRFRRLYGRTMALSGCIIGGGMLLMLPLIPPVVGAFWPSDFAGPVSTYAWILALGMVPAAFAVGLDAFYILTDQMKISLGITAVGALITIPTNVLLIVLLPETGAAWGLSLYRSWVLVHFAYVAWYFRHRAERGHWDR